MEKIRQVIALFLFVGMVLLTGCQISGGEIMITDFVTDKAMYHPAEEINFEMTLKNETAEEGSGTYRVSIYHLEKLVDTIEGQWSLNEERLDFSWQAPEEDFKGYLIKAEILDQKGKLLTEKTTAVDISSNWTKFPRYGYLTDFTSEANPEAIIEQMKNWQLNSIEYYDWNFLHHQPVPEDGSMSWQDWAGRNIDGNIVKKYIEEAKNKNIVNMSYNMIYAATNNYEEYGIKDEWGLWYAEDHGERRRQQGDRFTFHMGTSPSRQSDLFFFDIENPEWQDYIIAKNLEALEIMGFDGWHGDTVGEWGRMWTAGEVDTDASGKYVKDGYTEFLNRAKEKLGEKYLSFNPVGAQGIENVNKANVDVLYAEIWPWDFDSEGNQYDTYMSLKREVDQSRLESGGKSLIIPAYMQYDYAEIAMNKPFNMSAVLLTDAAVYAAGGSRIELGDGMSMLSNEYFPKNNLKMSEEHLQRQQNLQNFIVAYENLLRDGLEDNHNKIHIDGYESSSQGDPNKIWAYSKANENYETIQLINLLGVQSDDWRANEGKKETPTKVEHIEIKYYTDEAINSAWVTSPDPDFNSVSKELKIEQGTDETGNYVQVTVPSLEYWTMVYLKK